jgi:predicted ATPase/class 3 adenylate cyclase
MGGGDHELPAGVVSFLFTDIEGSTRLLRDLGDRYGELLDLHHALLRAAWAAHGGHELNTEGDAFVVVFAEASDAVAAAVDAQRELAAAAWPTAMPVRARIGIHTGYARPRGATYLALSLHQAARIVDAAHGGQVLVSGDTAARATALPAGARLERLGRFRVRDFDDPPELFRVVGAGLAQPDTAPRVRPAEGHNIVRPSTSFEDRDDDRAALMDLSRPGRATTIVGSGGAGKTRLAVETALDLAAEWDDGAWFVDLAPLSSGQVVPQAIAEAVGAKSTPGVDPWIDVLEHLRERAALVVLDNCEHVAESACARVVELLEACPRVGVLATSRTPLGLRAERVHRLDPLPCGDADSPAVRLFRHRAAAREPGDDPSVVALCAELDGLPLAIELAAARTTALAPKDILERLRSSPSVLQSRDHSLPARQRTLARLLDWSYDLLEPEARTVLRRLTVFAGTFDLETAELACAGDGLARTEVAELVWTLLDSSLVSAEAAAGTSRYRLLRTVRAYAAQRMAAAEHAATLRRLADRYLDRLGPSQATGRAWVGEVALELDNLRYVIAEVPDDATAQALAWSVGRYHDVTDAFRTGIEELTRWTQRLPAPGPNRVALLTLLADLHLRVGELGRAGALVDEAAELRAATGAAPWDPSGVARTRGELALRSGDAAGAAAEARRALTEPHSDRARARLQNLLGIALGTLGDVPGAAQAFEEELAAASAAGMETFLATTHGNLAEAQLQLGDEAAAAGHQAIALDLSRAYGQSVGIAFSMMIAARLSAVRGRARDAVVLQSAADEVLAGASYALYDEDAAVRAALIDAARSELGEAGFDRAVATGRGLDTDAAADLAASVLLAVRQRSSEQEATR